MAIPESRQAKALADLAERHFITEAAVLSTCHRVEVYAVAERFHGAVADVRHFLSELAFVPPEDFSDHLYVYYDDAAVNHLFGVAAGVDSVVVGESQILGQVRSAWERARTEGVAGPRLSSLFRHALEVGKRARTETSVARGLTSLSQAAVTMVEQRLGSLDGRHVVVLGAGEMGEGMAADVASIGAGAELVVASRTGERARRLAERVGGRALALSELSVALRDADVLLTSTGASSVVVDSSDVEAALRDRGGAPLLIVDLGMPRDVDPAVGDLAEVTLLDLGDVATFVDQGRDGKSGDLAQVRTIVADEVSRYLDAVSSRLVAPTVTALRRRAEEVRVSEVERYRARLGSLEAQEWQRVEALTRGILAKLLHDPTVRLKDAAGSAQGERLAGALQELFDL